MQLSALSSQLSALSSQLSALSSQLVAVLLGGALCAQANNAFSTHDNTTTATSSAALYEGWADVKAPGKAPPGVATGDGRIYSVGTIRVQTTDPADTPKFSGTAVQPADHPAGSWPVFSIPGTSGASRQVILVQCSDPDGSIQWQNFYYGDSGFPLLPATIARGCNARAISVWQGTTPAETRIAICGESHDATLPRSAQAPWSLTWNNIGPTGQLTNGMPSGFIAVYSGDGELLWSYEFRFDQMLGQCAVTDVSIRVEQAEGGPRDVVTYCGISSFGAVDPDSTESLAPLLPFTNLSSQLNFTPALGNATNGSGQWDGFVGRISHVHINPVPAQVVREFHSVVGGKHQDGLWGLAELDDDRFAVVGGSSVVTGASAGSPSFPFTIAPQMDWDVRGDYGVGVLMVFDAGPTRLTPPQDLLLDKATSLGTIGTERSHARDVIVQFDADPAAGAAGHEIVVVGATNDAQFFTTSSLLAVGPTLAPAVAHAGASDGFIAVTKDAVPVIFVFDEGTFQGEGSASGFTGVAAWNEYVDHIGVVGTAGSDLWLGSYWSHAPTMAYPTLLRSGAVLTSPNELPAAMGGHNATVAATFSQGSGLAYDDGLGLGSVAGGGIAVDERGRFHVVGSTSGLGYPTVGAQARAWRGGAADAIRSTFDLLPDRVGRSDQSGVLLHNGAPIPAVPLGMTGGTTPSAALLPFGRLVNGPVPSGSLRRMLIDWQGLAPSQTANASTPEHFLIVDRPPLSTQLAGSIIQFGVPTAPMALTSDKLELWLPSATTHMLMASPGAASLRVPLVLPAPIPGGATFSVQVVTADLVPYSCTGCSTIAATGAIVFSY